MSCVPPRSGRSSPRYSASAFRLMPNSHPLRRSPHRPRPHRRGPAPVDRYVVGQALPPSEPGTNSVEPHARRGHRHGARQEPRSEGGSADATDRGLPVAGGARGVLAETCRHIRLQQPVAAEQQLGPRSDPAVGEHRQPAIQHLDEPGVAVARRHVQRQLQQQPAGHELSADASESGVQHVAHGQLFPAVAERVHGRQHAQRPEDHGHPASDCRRSAHGHDREHQVLGARGVLEPETGHRADRDRTARARPGEPALSGQSDQGRDRHDGANRHGAVRGPGRGIRASPAGGAHRLADGRTESQAVAGQRSGRRGVQANDQPGRAGDPHRAECRYPLGGAHGARTADRPRAGAEEHRDLATQPRSEQGPDETRFAAQHAVSVGGPRRSDPDGPGRRRSSRRSPAVLSMHSARSGGSTSRPGP